ncbi:hypothetical protein CKF43_20970 [Pantoea graminicola]|nr:hypothetical protein CKF43_20970 [Pantoea sp. ARC607]
MISEPRDRNKPHTKVSFRYDPLGRHIIKTRQQLFQGRPSGNAVTTRFVWEGYRLLQKIHDGTPLTYVRATARVMKRWRVLMVWKARRFTGSIMPPTGCRSC